MSDDHPLSVQQLDGLKIYKYRYCGVNVVVVVVCCSDTFYQLNGSQDIKLYNFAITVHSNCVLSC